MATNEYFMGMALKLAKKGMGWTNPNPMVGAVIVKHGRIIGQGYHRQVGKAHAEVEALKSVRENPRGATLYVNLEPCCHYGKTPPCVEAVIEAGIKKVVCAVLDPNPRVRGKGVRDLRQAGIEVNVGVLKTEAKQLNEVFIVFHEKIRPFVAIKFAASLDGKIATKTGDTKWITSEKARYYSRKLRAQYQAILVGINTVIHDNPHLGARMKGKKDPLRIILDSSLRMPLSSQVLRDDNVLVVTTTKANRKKLQLLEGGGAAVYVCKDSTINLAELMDELAKRDIISVLVEGGGTVIGSFADNELVDKVYAFQASILIGGKKAVSAVEGKGVDLVKNALSLNRVSYKHFGTTLLTMGYPNS